VVDAAVRGDVDAEGDSQIFKLANACADVGQVRGGQIAQLQA
jgi:hypothetical protein